MKSKSSAAAVGGEPSAGAAAQAPAAIQYSSAEKSPRTRSAAGSRARTAAWRGPAAPSRSTAAAAAS